jgi:hypothetical protein
LFKPSLNAVRSISVLTQYATKDFSPAISLANQLIALFPPEHFMHNRFMEMLEDLKQAQSAYNLIEDRIFDANNEASGKPISDSTSL